MTTKQHKYSQLISIGHPREPGKCKFVEQLRKSGKLKELLQKGRIPVKNINNIQSLPCPVCHSSNPVSRANLRVKCSNCGSQLLSIRIKKKIKNRK